MFGIALYNVLTKVGATPEEAEKAVADVANSKEVTTKADLQAGLANLEIRLVKQMYAVAGIVIAAVGLMFAVAALTIKFL